MTTSNKTTEKTEAAGVQPLLDCERMDCRELTLEGTVYKTLFTPKFRNKKKWIKPDPDKLMSFIPGTITGIAVKEGDAVTPGDDLLTLEAMKMQNKVKAQREAVVEKILVKVGDRIPKGQPMILFK